MSRSGVLLTTSQTLQGHEIVRHVDIVSAQVVQGAGLVSEFFAGFTDIFGGRSRAFQEQLDLAKDAVIQLLEEKVKRLGGNGLIGFRIDFDEISGKNTQMFMVSASGMAVVIARAGGGAEGDLPETAGVVTAAEVEHRITLKGHMDAINSRQLRPDEDFWRFLVASRDARFAPWAFDYLSRRWMPSGVTVADSFDYTVNKERVFDYLDGLDDVIVADLVHQEVPRTCSWGLILDYAKRRGIVDYARCLALLEKGEAGMHPRINALLAISKAAYREEDAARMEALCAFIQGGLLRERKVLEIRKLIGSRQAWVCPACSRPVDLADPRCLECGSDPEGFKDGQTGYSAVLKGLRARIDAVRSLLAGEAEATAYAPQ